MMKLLYFTKEELRKQFQSSKLKVLIAISFLIGLLFVFLGGRIGLTGNLSVISLELLLMFVLPLFMAVLGSDLMISEFKDGTIKNVLRLPLSKEIVFLGKMLSGWIAGALIIASVFVPTLIGSMLLNGIPAISAIGESIAVFVGAIIFCGLLVVLSNCLALWMGNGAVGLIVSIVLWMAMGVAGLFMPQLKRFFLTDFTNWVKPMLYTDEASLSLTALIFMIAYYIIGIILGLLAFQRKEI